jgi:hypothetical protein
MKNIIVTGAGSTDFNGYYIEDGYSAGKPLYRYNSSYVIKWIVGEWKITNAILAVYSSTEDVATPDLVTTWAQVLGDLPVPTVTAYYTNLFYTLYFDWDGNDVLDTANEAPYMVRYAIDRGRDTLIQPSGGGFTPQEIGKLYLTLDNSSGRFSPWATTDIAPSGGPITPGHMMKLSALVGGSTDQTTYSVFTGYVSDIQESGYRDTVNIVCEDYWRLFSEGTLFNKAYGGTTPTNYPFTYIRDDILTKYGWSFGSTVSTDIVYDGLANFTYCDNISYKKEIENVANAALARVDIGSDGEFRYRPLDSTDNAVMTITQDEVLKDVYLPTPWENTRDKIILKAHDYTFGYTYDSTGLLYSLTQPISLPTSDSYKFAINYRYNNESVVGFSESIDWAVWTSTGGTGTNLTASCTDSETYFNNKSVIIITNGSTADGYITQFDINGSYIKNVPYDIEFTATTDSNNTFILESPYLSVYKQSTSDGKFEYVSGAGGIDTDKQLIQLQDVGNTLLNYLKTPRVYPTIQMQGRYSDQFILDIEDKVTLTLGNFGINSDYRVLKITHEAEGNCQDVLSTFKLYPVMTRST